MSVTAQSEVGPLRRVLLKHPGAAFADLDRIRREWKPLNFMAPPDLARALDEYDRFVEILRSTGATIDLLPDAAGTGLDSIYVRDASIACDRGIIICQMGKAQREEEPAAQEAFLSSIGYPVAGRIEPPGRLEGGDAAWLDSKTIAVGRGYRTNAEGIRQLATLLGSGIEVVTVPLPHWRGPSDVFHLMSILSPVAPGVAVVHSRLMPVPFRELLLERGFTLIDVPEDEFETMGTNVLALGPDRCLMVAGNPRTRALIEAAGIDVEIYEGTEISLKGGGGPTCLTRPLERLKA